MFCISLFISIPYVVFMIMLFTRTFVQLYSNLTTIEAMGAFRGNNHGPSQKRLPCIGVTKSQEENMPNQYDLLWPNNLRLVLGENVLCWLLPWVLPDKEEMGYNVTRIPEVIPYEILQLERDGYLTSMRKDIKTKYETKERFETSIENYVKKAMAKYDNANIYIQSERDLYSERKYDQMNDIQIEEINDINNG